MMRNVSSREAELASRSCRIAGSPAIAHTESATFRRLPAIYRTPIRGALEHSILRIVSVAEVFDCDCLRMSVELFLPAQHEAAQAVWRQAVDGAEGTWPKRCEARRTWFAIDVSKSATYVNLKPFIDVRNALAHGLGSLTRLQLGKDNGANIRTALGAAGVPMDGNRIVLDGATVQRCVGAGVAHISWLDRECAARGLRQRGQHAASHLFDE